METGDGEDACRACELLPTKGKKVLPKSTCPGESACSWFAQSAGADREAKERDCCIGVTTEDAKDEAKLSAKKKSPLCQFYRSKPLPNLEKVDVNEDLADAGEVEKLVNEIADIVFWEDAGSGTDWTLYPFETRQLYGIWREAEKQIAKIQAAKMQMFIKSFWSAS